MGLFGGDDDNGSDEARQARMLQEQQINQNKLELEQKRSSLAQQRMNILRSEGGANWSADRSASFASNQGQSPSPASGSFFDKFADMFMRSKIAEIKALHPNANIG